MHKTMIAAYLVVAAALPSLAHAQEQDPARQPGDLGAEVRVRAEFYLQSSPAAQVLYLLAVQRQS